MADNLNWEVLFPGPTDQNLYKKHMDIPEPTSDDVGIIRERVEKYLQDIEPDTQLIQIKIGDEVVFGPAFKINTRNLSPNPEKPIGAKIPKFEKGMISQSLNSVGSPYNTFMPLDTIIKQEEDWDKTEPGTEIHDAAFETIDTVDKAQAELSTISKEIYRTLVYQKNLSRDLSQQILFYAAYKCYDNANELLLNLTKDTKEDLEKLFNKLKESTFSKYKDISSITGPDGTDYKKEIDSVISEKSGAGHKLNILKEHGTREPEKYIKPVDPSLNETFEKAKLKQLAVQDYVEREFTDLTEQDKLNIAYYIFDKIYDIKNPLGHNIVINAFNRNWYYQMRDGKIVRHEILSSEDFKNLDEKNAQIAGYIDNLVSEWGKKPDPDRVYQTEEIETPLSATYWGKIKPQSEAERSAIESANEEEYARADKVAKALQAAEKFKNIKKQIARKNATKETATEIDPNSISPKMKLEEATISDLTLYVTAYNAPAFKIEVANVVGENVIHIYKFYLRQHNLLRRRVIIPEETVEKPDLDISEHSTELNNKLKSWQNLSYDKLVELSDEEYDTVDELMDEWEEKNPAPDISNERAYTEWRHKYYLMSETTIQKVAEDKLIDEMMDLGYSFSRNNAAEIINNIFTTAKMKKLDRTIPPIYGPSKSYMETPRDFEKHDLSSETKQQQFAEAQKAAKDDLVRGNYVYEKVTDETPWWGIEDPIVVNGIAYIRAGLAFGKSAPGKITENGYTYRLIKKAEDNPENKPTVQFNGYDYIVDSSLSGDEESYQRYYNSLSPEQQEKLNQLNNK